MRVPPSGSRDVRNGQGGGGKRRRKKEEEDAIVREQPGQRAKE